MLRSQAITQGCDQLLSNAFGLDPANIEGILVGQGVVVQQLHGHRCRQLLRRLK